MTIRNLNCYVFSVLAQFTKQPSLRYYESVCLKLSMYLDVQGGTVVWRKHPRAVHPGGPGLNPINSQSFIMEIKNYNYLNTIKWERDRGKRNKHLSLIKYDQNCGKRREEKVA